MKIKNLFFRLIEIHRRLDTRIRMEQRSRFPRDLTLLRLKKLKLKVKDRLAYMLTNAGMVQRWP